MSLDKLYHRFNVQEAFVLKTRRAHSHFWLRIHLLIHVMSHSHMPVMSTTLKIILNLIIRVMFFYRHEDLQNQQLRMLMMAVHFKQTTPHSCSRYDVMHMLSNGEQLS